MEIRHKRDKRLFIWSDEEGEVMIRTIEGVEEVEAAQRREAQERQRVRVRDLPLSVCLLPCQDKAPLKQTLCEQDEKSKRSSHYTSCNLTLSFTIKDTGTTPLLFFHL